MRKTGAASPIRVAVNMRMSFTVLKMRSIIGCRELGVVTDEGECTRRRRRVQEVCAFILRGDTGERRKGLDTWSLSGEKKDCKEKRSGRRIRLGNEKETDAEDTTHNSRTRKAEGHSECTNHEHQRRNPQCIRGARRHVVPRPRWPHRSPHILRTAL